jgi:hypothetical protein
LSQSTRSPMDGMMSKATPRTSMLSGSKSIIRIKPAC